MGERMNVIIKVLKGEECTVQVSPETLVLELKRKIKKLLRIPISHQKLLIIGRALVDEHKISCYSNITDGTKLTLVVMKPDPLKEVMYRCFRRHYNEQQSERLTAEFLLDFEKKVKQFSLDDIERIVGVFISQEDDY